MRCTIQCVSLFSVSFKTDRYRYLYISTKDRHGQYRYCGSGIRDPGSGMDKKNQDPDPGSGSGMNIPDHIASSFGTIFGVKILKFFDADPDPGSGNLFDPGIRDRKNSDPG